MGNSDDLAGLSRARHQTIKFWKCKKKLKKKSSSCKLENVTACSLFIVNLGKKMTGDYNVHKYVPGAFKSARLMRKNKLSPVKLKFRYVFK